MKSAWETAFATHQRVFFESSTETIRTCPENYCLAYREMGHWKVYDREGATRDKHKSIGQFLRDDCDPSVICLALSSLFKCNAGQ